MSKVNNFSNLLLLCFKPHMLIINPNKENIISFISGYDFALPDKHVLWNKIKNHMADNYKIKYTKLGWPHQIDRYTDFNSQEWETSFFKILLEIILEQKELLNEKNIEYLKDQILRIISNTKNKGIAKNKEKWFILCALEDSYTKELLDIREYQIYKTLKENYILN